MTHHYWQSMANNGELYPVWLYRVSWLFRQLAYKCSNLLFFTARRYASAIYAVVVCPSVRLSVTSRHCTKRLNIGSRKQRHTIVCNPKLHTSWCTVEFWTAETGEEMHRVCTELAEEHPAMVDRPWSYLRVSVTIWPAAFRTRWSRSRMALK